MTVKEDTMRREWIQLLYLFSAAACISCRSGVGGSMGGYCIGVSSVTLDAAEASILTGKKIQLSSSVLPANAANPAVQWTSSDPEIAEVSAAGLVKGVSAGTAVISVISVDSPDIKDRCTVTVSNPPDFTETPTSGASDYATPDGIVFRLIASPDISISSKFPFGRRFINGGYEPERYVAVPARFRLADTETTYEIWKEVYDWATDPERGGNAYSFAHPGTMGGDNGGNTARTARHPAASVTWDDVMVWCNALTEYYNATNGAAADLACVYTSGGSVIRSSLNDAACIAAECGAAAGGFRLPTTREWEFAARYLGTLQPETPYSNYILSDGYYYQKDSASGNVAYNGGDYYAVLSKESTAEVRSKLPNFFGAYDMSGNVSEWCFDPGTTLSDPGIRILRGGGFRFKDDTCDGGYENENYTTVVDMSYGFRLARNL